VANNLRLAGFPRVDLRDLNGGAAGASRVPLTVAVFDIDGPRGSIDPLAKASADQIAKGIPKADADKIEDELRKAGNSTNIAKVTSLLNKKPLDDTMRLLLADRKIYLKSLDKAVTAVGKNYQDTEGIADGVLRDLEDLREAFIGDLVKDVLKAQGVDVANADNAKRVKAAIQRLGKAPSIAAGKIEPAILESYDSAVKIGGVPKKVAEYLTKEGVPTQSPEIQRSMAEYLLNFVGIDPKKLDVNKHEEFFALAFEYARRRGHGEDDPIDAVRTKGATSEWDYNVELFEAADEQPVIAENILVAGALDYLWNLGEFMGVFKIADSVILEWGAGMLDVTGESADKLYRYYKLRDERSSQEERGMLYRRVLGRGDAEVLSDAVVNDAFAGLWHKLMTEVARYVRKIERVEVEKVRVSASAIYQAARDLQYNLTEFGTGLAHKQAFEIYKNFEEAMEMLGDPQVVEHYTSGRRKNVWAVIERIAKSKFGITVNISALKTLAVEGNKVFRWLAEFRYAQPASSDLQALLGASEAWIIAQAEVEGQEAPEEEAEPDEKDEEGEAEDDVDQDWNA
jgi:hypothetical protein